MNIEKSVISNNYARKVGPRVYELNPLSASHDMLRNECESIEAGGSMPRIDQLSFTGFNSHTRTIIYQAKRYN